MFDVVTNILNTREQAILIWLLIVLVWFFSQKKGIKILSNFFRILFSFKVLVVILGSVVYTFVVLYLLSSFSLWNFSLLKDATFWFFGSALVLLLNLNDSIKDTDYFKKLFLENIKIMVLITFVVNFYTLPLLVEFLLVPFLIFITALSAFSATQEKYKPVKKFSDFILVFCGLLLFLFAFSKLSNDWQSVLTYNNLLSLLLPILLTACFIPYLYAFALVMTYESLLVRIDMFVAKRNKQLAKTVKRKLFKLFGLNLQGLIHFTQNNMGRVIQIHTEEDLSDLLKAQEHER